MPLYHDEDLILCDMPLAKCYGQIHAIADQNGAQTVWADEQEGSQSATMQQARNIIRGMYHG